MGVVESKTFKSGNSVAVRLPKEIAFAADTAVMIERKGDVLTIRPAKDAAAERARVRDLANRLRALGPVGEVEQYDSTFYDDDDGPSTT